MNATLINLGYPLGDTIAALPYVDKYCKESGEECYVHLGNAFHPQLFKNSYPDMRFVDSNRGVLYTKTLWLEHDHQYSIQKGFARQLGYEDVPYIRPKIDSFKKERPVKNKFVTLGIHSTAQLKYWNHPDGLKAQREAVYWNELCHKLRKAGVTPVVIEKD